MLLNQGSSSMNIQRFRRRVCWFLAVLTIATMARGLSAIEQEGQRTTSRDELRQRASLLSGSGVQSVTLEPVQPIDQNFQQHKGPVDVRLGVTLAPGVKPVFPNLLRLGKDRVL